MSEGGDDSSQEKSFDASLVVIARRKFSPP